MNINKILNKVTFFYKLAGILPYPPKMKEDILKFINESYNDYKLNKKRKFSKLIKIDLSGLPNQYSQLQKEFEGQDFSIFTVIEIIEDKDLNKLEKTTGGYWSPTFNELKINLFVDSNGILSSQTVNIVEHELIHMMQTLLKTYLPRLNDHPNALKAKPGYPREWKLSEDELNDEYQQMGRHYHSSGIEFFSQLQDNIENFKNFTNKTKYDFLRFIHGTEFFVNLKLEKPKLWERAVKEAWKALSDDFDTDQEKELEAKNNYDNWKFLSTNKVELLDKAKKIGFNKIFKLEESDPLIQEAFKKLLNSQNLADYNENKFLFIKDNAMNGIEFCIIQDDETIPLILLMPPK